MTKINIPEMRKWTESEDFESGDFIGYGEHDKLMNALEKAYAQLEAADKLADETEHALTSNDGSTNYLRQAIAEYRSLRREECT